MGRWGFKKCLLQAAAFQLRLKDIRQLARWKGRREKFIEERALGGAGSGGGSSSEWVKPREMLVVGRGQGAEEGRAGWPWT